MKKTILAAMLVIGASSFAYGQGDGGAGGEPPRASDPRPPGTLQQQPGNNSSNTPNAMRRGDDMAPLSTAPVSGRDPGVPTTEQSPANKGGRK